MKKYLISFLLIALMMTPFVGQTFTLSELYAQLARLQAQITALQNQPDQAITPDCPFSRDLSFGDGPNNRLRAEVVALQKWLIGSYLNIPRPTGYFGSLTRLAISRWQRENGLVVTGRIGANERAILCGLNNNNPNAITINSVSGPTSISVGQTGTWQVKATAPVGLNLTYSVDWGDNRGTPTSGSNSSANFGSVNQTSTFTHAYDRAGTYIVKFMVDNGVVCITAPCTPRKSAEASLTVVVGGGVISNNLSITYPADPANWHDYVGGNYSKIFSVVNALPSRYYTWSISTGSLPPGLNLTNQMIACSMAPCIVGQYCPPCPNGSSQIIISGTPTQSGHFPFTLNVRDNLGNTGSLNVYIDIETNLVVCALDAYRCPNGLYVGRTGPSCQFVCSN